MIRLVPLFITSLLLSGCGLFTTTVVEEKIVFVTKYRTIDDHLLDYCPIVPPPDQTAYKRSTDRERVDLWLGTYATQVEKLKLRNLKIDELRELNKYLSETYDEKLTEE